MWRDLPTFTNWEISHKNPDLPLSWKNRWSGYPEPAVLAWQHCRPGASPHQLSSSLTSVSLNLANYSLAHWKFPIRSVDSESGIIFLENNWTQGLLESRVSNCVRGCLAAPIQFFPQAWQSAGVHFHKHSSERRWINDRRCHDRKFVWQGTRNEMK